MAITVTQEGKLKLEEELSYLKNVKRKEVTEAIRIALGFGDLSENSEYDEAKTEQGKVENRIAELEEMLKNEINTDAVSVGSKVRIYNEKWDEEILYAIVGSTEADPLQNKISDMSPIGKAILGHKVGDAVVVETPQGHVNVKILEITK